MLLEQLCYPTNEKGMFKLARIPYFIPVLCNRNYKVLYESVKFFQVGFLVLTPNKKRQETKVMCDDKKIKQA